MYGLYDDVVVLVIDEAIVAPSRLFLHPLDDRYAFRTQLRWWGWLWVMDEDDDQWWVRMMDEDEWGWLWVMDEDHDDIYNSGDSGCSHCNIDNNNDDDDDNEHGMRSFIQPSICKRHVQLSLPSRSNHQPRSWSPASLVRDWHCCLVCWCRTESRYDSREWGGV